ncbi:MAG: hypothetical protein HY216_11640 [Candidatus Rokubacteria bacterium]|nr:hypothetical protein [Candidatus Rokubacteria bacterium]
MPRANVSTASILLLVVALIAGCGAGRVVLPFSIDPEAAPAPRDARAFETDEQAVRGIAAILSQELHLPVPPVFTVYVYDSRHTFERGLIQDARVSPVRAAEFSEFALGVGKRRQLLLNEEGTDGRGREWLRLIAHEMAHLCQIELTQGEGRGEQWLAEGMAEWVAFAVLERLGLDTRQNQRELARLGIRNFAALAAAKLDLETLGTPRGFTIRHRQEGALPTYQLAFLMADHLITREGLPQLVYYFSLFSEHRDRKGNFQQAFGQTLGEFEAEVVTTLTTALP